VSMFVTFTLCYRGSNNTFEGWARVGCDNNRVKWLDRRLSLPVSKNIRTETFPRLFAVLVLHRAVVELKDHESSSVRT
jgi:hypothetical protein